VQQAAAQLSPHRGDNSSGLIGAVTPQERHRFLALPASIGQIRSPGEVSVEGPSLVGER
jgi:hypothetical protein